MDKNHTDNNQNYDLTSGYTADDEEAPTPSRATIIWNRILKITLLFDLVLILLVGSYCLYKYIGGDEIVPPAADLEYTPQPFNQKLAKEVLDYQDPNPLMSAIVTDQPLTEIQKILDSGIDVNAQDATGNTALHYAVFREDRKLIKLLLNHGSNRRIKNHKEQSCTDVSFQISPRKIGFIIIAPEDYDDNGIITRASILRHTLEHSFSIDFLIPYYFVPLILCIVWAARSNCPDHRSLKTISRFFLSYNIISLSLILISYVFYIFSRDYPYQYIINSFPNELIGIAGCLLFTLAAYIAYLLSRRYNNLFQK